MSIQDYGPGNPHVFSADDLERWFDGEEVDNDAPRIEGRVLNELLGVTTYTPDALYVVMPDGMVKL